MSLLQGLVHDSNGNWVKDANALGLDAAAKFPTSSITSFPTLADVPAGYVGYIDIGGSFYYGNGTDILPTGSRLLNIASGLQYNKYFDATIRYANFQTPLVVESDVNGFYITFPNWYYDLSGDQTEKGSGSAITIEASIIKNNNDFTRITFSGVNSGTIPDARKLKSDYINLAVKAGERIKIAGFLTCPSGLMYSLQGFMDINTGCAFEYSATALTSKVMGGVIVNNTSSRSYFPTSLIGLTDRPSIMAISTSQGMGVVDTPDETLSVGHFRSLKALRLPYLNAGCGSDNGAKFNASNTNRLDEAQYYNNFIVDLAVNDLGYGFAQCEITAKELLRSLPANSGKFLATITPYGTTTDQCATLANQTVSAREADRLAYNDWVRTGVKGVSGYIDNERACESSFRSGKWQLNMSHDMIHAIGLNGNMLPVLANVVDPAMFKNPDYISDAIAYDLVTIFSGTFTTAGAKALTTSPALYHSYISQDGSTQTGSYSKTVAAGDSILFQTRYPEQITRIDWSSKTLGSSLMLSNIEKLINLQLLNLTGNTITGGIPLGLSKLTKLTDLYLSSNVLGGTIPDLSALKLLVNLRMSACGLAGNIPNFDNATTLGTVFFNANSLSGWDGTVLASTLKTFNVVNNALPQATINALLVALQTAGVTGCAISMNGGTNGVPSGAGATAKTALISAGNTVVTN